MSINEIELIVPTDLDRLAETSTEDLRAELSSALDLTARTLKRVALIVRVLEERGEDLSDLKLGFFQPYLRQIAHGQVIAELVSRFSENRMLLSRAAALPLPDQHQLAIGAPVTLVVRRPDGRPDHRMVDPLKMTRSQITQVFGPRGIRDEAEQILLLEDRASEPPSKPKLVSLGQITADCRQGVLRVGRTLLDPATVVAALAALAANCESDGDEENRTAMATAPLTPTQHEALQAHAARGNTTVAALVRRALGAHGLLAGPQKR